MSVQLAYLGVILIWATTPLAIKVSNQEVSFLFGVLARMAIGAALCWAVLLVLRIRLPLDTAARRTYAAAALGIFGSMLATYWGAQYITSGMVSVVFGVTPLATGIMAAAWLGERNLSPVRVSGILFGFAGLCAVFLAGARMEVGAARGIAAVFVAALLHSASAVWVKRLGSDVHAVALNAGALAIAVPLFAVMWLLFDGSLPQAGARGWGAITYLGVLGTGLGFVLYFHILKHLSAGVISLITLVTPVLALLIGHWLNHEAIHAMVWVGTLCIIAGLLLYQWGPRLLRREA
jgi:drug/metabolite transporter (DMT)-like permease